MAVLGVVLGVTSIVSVHLVSASVAAQLDSLVPAPLQGLDLALTRKNGLVKATDYFALRKAWRADELTDVQDLWPVIDESLLVGGRRVRVLGIDFIARIDALPTNFEGFDAARASSLTNVGQSVWLAKNLRDIVEADARFETLTIAGELDLVDVILLDIGPAQALLGWAQQDTISYVALAMKNPILDTYRWLDDVAPGASAGLPEIAPIDIPEWQTKGVGELQPADRFGRAVLFNVGALGLLALVVSWFLIYQVAVAWLRRLWQVFSRLHVLGVSSVELRAYFLGLLAALSAIAGAIGLWWGYVLAELLLQVGIGGTFNLKLDSWLILKAFGSSLIVCMVGGYWAYKNISREQASARTNRTWILLAASVAIALGIFWQNSSLLGAFLAIAGSCVVLLAALMPVLGLLRHLSSKLTGNLLLRMSLREVVWFPRDVWIALSGLILAVATAVGVSLMVDSFRAEFSQMLEQRLSYNFSVEGEPDALIDLFETAQRHHAVGRVQAYFESRARISGVPVAISYSRLDDAETMRYGFANSVAQNEVMVSEQTSRLLQVDVGNSLEIDGLEYQVKHVFKSFGDMLPRIVMDAGARPGQALVVSLSLSLVDPLMALPEALQMPGELRWQNQKTIRDLALETFDRTFAITSILIFIAVLVAGIGIYIATTVLRLNQQASARLLVGMGVTRAEVWGIDFARGLGIGMIACLLALPLGCAIGWLLCNVVNPRAFGWTVTLLLAWNSMVLPLFWGMVAAVMATLIRVGQQEQGRMDAVAR